MRSACVQLARYLEGGPLMWMMPLQLHVNQKSDYDMIFVLIRVILYVLEIQTLSFCSLKNIGFHGWDSQNVCQNSKAV